MYVGSSANHRELRIIAVLAPTNLPHTCVTHPHWVLGSRNKESSVVNQACCSSVDGTYFCRGGHVGAAPEFRHVCLHVLGVTDPAEHTQDKMDNIIMRRGTLAFCAACGECWKLDY